MSVKSKIISADGLSGNISLSATDGLHIKFNLTMAKKINDTDVIKLYLSSASHPNTPPFNCGVAQMQGRDFRLTKNIKDLSPYSPEEIDTAEIILKNVFTEESSVIAKVSFAEEEKEYDEPDMDAIRKKLSYLQEHEAYRAYLDESESMPTPVEAAAIALDNLYKEISHSRPDITGKMYMEHIRDFAEEQTEIEFVGGEYKWYRCLYPQSPVNAEALEHIFSVPEVSACIRKHKHWILGINGTSDTVCIAVPVNINTPNPLPHIDDCTVYIRSAKPDMEYCTVCVSFEPDGQYFMPIC